MSFLLQAIRLLLIVAGTVLALALLFVGLVASMFFDRPEYSRHSPDYERYSAILPELRKSIDSGTRPVTVDFAGLNGGSWQMVACSADTRIPSK